MDLSAITASLTALVISVILHEIAHGVAALACGDPTAYRAGRLNPNPLRHIDPVGSVVLPLTLVLTNAPFLFGYAKPVPVRFDLLRRPKRDTVIVAGAGPFVNLVLALLTVLALHLVPAIQAEGAVGWVQNFLMSMLILNLLLMWFNLLPVLPLDGGRIAFAFAPRRWEPYLPKLEKIGIVLVLAVLFVIPALLVYVGVRLDLARWVLAEPVMRLSDWLLKLGGHMP